jgi:hypothetical protein
MTKPTLKDWQTWAIIGLMIVVTVVSRSYTNTLHDVNDLQIALQAEADRNCNRDNYRISIATAAYLQLSKASRNTAEVWRMVDQLLADLKLDPNNQLRSLAQQQVGINIVQEKALFQLALAIGNAEGDNSVDPYSHDLTLRAQQKC